MLAPTVTAADIVVSDDAFGYLRLQKGKLDPLAGDRALWLAAYRLALDHDYRLIRPYLPARREGHALKLLDVGSGLGGVDVLLSRHYGGQAQVILLDGVDDPPEMRLHRETFNSMAVAEEFHRQNGAPPIGWVDAATVANKTPPGCFKPIACDLILSLGSWCFHYAPAVYLPMVQQLCRAGTVLIVDVRKGRPEWAAQLMNAFALQAIVHASDKFDRMVLRAV